MNAIVVNPPTTIIAIMSAESKRRKRFIFEGGRACPYVPLTMIPTGGGSVIGDCEGDQDQTQPCNEEDQADGIKLPEEVDGEILPSSLLSDQLPHTDQLACLRGLPLGIGESRDDRYRCERYQDGEHAYPPPGGGAIPTTQRLDYISIENATYLHELLSKIA